MEAMKPNKKVLDALILILIITSIIVPITIIEGLKYIALTNPTSELNRGIQVSYEEIPQSGPIVILNPKDFNIFYQSGTDRDHILLNYRTVPGVTAQEYVLDGEVPQVIPPDNIIQTPGIGNHTLMLTGMNSTGGSCNSEIVHFYIKDTFSGGCGAPPMYYDYTNKSTVQFARSGHDYGLVTDTRFVQEIFLEGPMISKTNRGYTRNIDLKYQEIGTFVPLTILRSEPWYKHSQYIEASFWFNLVRDDEIVDRIRMNCGVDYMASGGETLIIYYLVTIFHVFGSVTYWNGETRYYDVFNIENIHYDCRGDMQYGVNESILEYPLLGSVDYSQFPHEYYDENLSENESWKWEMHENLIQSYGIEANVFLGNYAGIDSCPVPVRFSLRQSNIHYNDLIPNEIIHTFTRTGYEPDTFDANRRGLENTFSLNILPI